MSRGKHESGASTTPRGLVLAAAGALMVIAGTALGAVAVAELLRYSPYEDPGAGKAGLWLGIAAAVLAGVPLSALSGWVLIKLLKAYTAWKKTLTPEQRAALAWAEAAAMLSAHLWLQRRNKETDAKLTRSVMGDRPYPPDGKWMP